MPLPSYHAREKECFGLWIGKGSWRDWIGLSRLVRPQDMDVYHNHLDGCYVVAGEDDGG